MDTNMDNSRLRRSPPGEVAIYLCQVLETVPEEVISAHLFASVESQSLPPTVFAVWMSIAQTSATLLEALTQDFSVITRRIAIKRLCKLLRRRRWKETWEAIGGAQGIIALLKKFSVFDVKLFLSLVPRSVKGIENSGKDIKIDDLFQALNNPFSLAAVSDSPSRSGVPSKDHNQPDERPLARHYQVLLPGCSSKFLDKTMREKTNPGSCVSIEHKANAKLLKQHYRMLQHQCLDSIFNSKYLGMRVDHYLIPLLSEHPRLPSSVAGLSESMAFSLLFLRKLVSQPHFKLSHGTVSILSAVVEPLLRKAWKKRLDCAIVKEIFDLCIAYLASKPEEKIKLNFRQDNLLNLCVKFWSSSNIHRQDFETQLISILKLFSLDHSPSIDDFCTAVLWAPKHLRYHLLKICFLHSASKSIDIDDSRNLAELHSQTWPSTLFFVLDRGDAITLLRKLCATLTDSTFLGRRWDKTILSHSASPISSGADPTLLLNLLEDGEAETLCRAKASVAVHKKKAENSREQSERAFHAKSALFYAISSGSLEVYGDVLIWARRFVRDPLTLKTVFGEDSIRTSEGLELLSGIPRKLGDLKPSVIASRILLSNEIILELLQTACLALREPSFFSSDWKPSLWLISDVISGRLAACKGLQQSLKLKDDQLYDLIFESTLNTALRIEKMGQDMDYQRLDILSPAFPMKNKNCQVTVPAAYRFVDQLALARDKIWCEYRLMHNSTISVLPPSFPRGLPIQVLDLGFDLSGDLLGATPHSLTPYIRSRAERVVFGKPEDMFYTISDDDDDLKIAVSSFIDSYRYALGFCVGQDLSTPQIARRAWEHATQNLSQRMAPDEAQRTWARQFRQVLPTFRPYDSELNSDAETHLDYPVFPFDADIMEYNEWNPAENFHPRPAVKSRKLKPATCLDCCLTIGDRDCWDLKGNPLNAELHTVGLDPIKGHIWKWRGRLAKPTVQEGVVVSALLYLEQFIPNHHSIFAKPFPSTADTRYPPVWLDMSFTEDKNFVTENDNDAFNALYTLRFVIPPAVLHALTESALNALLDALPSAAVGETAKLERIAYGFLCLLVQSDRPFLAADLVLKVIIDIPTSSSWHRKLMSVGLLRCLPPEKAKNLIHSFATAIEKKLTAAPTASVVNSGVSSTTNAPPTRPYVKITTIKYLAQLLQDAEFVSQTFSINVLGVLLKTSTHIDVRVAIVESLINMLGDCPDDPTYSTGNQIIQILKSIIPIAGSLDETRNFTEEDWEQAEMTSVPPLVYNQGSGRLDLMVPPILDTVLRNIEHAFKHTWKKKVLDQVLLPILQLSIETNTRWVEIFAKKYELNLDSLSLPALPVKPKLLSDLLQRCVNHLPPWVFERYSRFILANIAPHPEIAELHKKLADRHFASLPEVAHWRSLYGHGPSIGVYNGFSLIRLLRSKDGLFEHIQKHALQHAKVLIALDEAMEFEQYMGAFMPNSGPITTGLRWLNGAHPVLERIIADIDSRRTASWQRNPNRQPSSLPQTLKYELLLLPYPAFDAENDQIEAFTEELRGFIRGLDQPGKAYHEDWPEIRNCFSRVVPAHRAMVACSLGALREGGEMRLYDLLCVDLARDFWNGAVLSKDADILAKWKTVVKSWTASENEGVRTKGLGFMKALEV